MKISIIIPVYNVENYLKSCIDSVIRQSYKNIEIILINDGSTDNSKEICEQYEKNYTFIKLINKKNGGLSDARNVGILNSTGEYLVFLDSDDYWDDDQFLFEITLIIKKNLAIDYIFFRYKYFYQNQNKFIENSFYINEKIKFWESGIECLEFIFNKTPKFQWFAWMGVVRREFLIENNLFFIKGRKYEDMLWTPHVFLKAKSIGFYNSVVYVYRLERKGQITNIVSSKSLEDNIFIATSWYEYLKNSLINDNLKNKMHINFNALYFYAIKYTGFLDSKERKRIISMVHNNKNLLKYYDGANTMIMLLCNTIGFKLTIKLLHVIIRLKNMNHFSLEINKTD